MTRKRMAMGLAAMAAMAAVATGAMATLAHSEETNGFFTAVNTATGKNVAAIYDGVQSSSPIIRAPSWELICEKAKFSAKTDTGDDMTLTFTPSYTECDIYYEHENELKKFPAEVVMNGCDYTFDWPTKQKKDEFSGLIDIQCATKPIEIIAFDIGNTELHSGKICVFSIATVEHLGKTTYEDQTATKPTYFTLKAEIKKIPYEENGTTCPDTTATQYVDGELLGGSTITATTSDGKTQIDAEVSG
jgi:hypothetical protein